MAQTILGKTFKNVKVDAGTNGTVWTALSGHATSVEIDGGDRATEDTFTADGDTPIVSTGKRESVGVTVNVVYTEAAGEAYSLAKTSYETDADLYLRWSPFGGVTGQFQFVAQGKVTTAPYPVGEVGEAALIPVAITIRASAIVQSAAV